MDKVDEERRGAIISNKKNQFQPKSSNFQIEFYPTSIWETSTYIAFSNILSEVVKKKEIIKKFLEEYGKACGADEVIIFDRKTFLVIASYSGKEFKNEERMETISYLMKKFKSPNSEVTNKFSELVINNKVNTIYLDEFTRNSYILVALSNKKISLELLKLNMKFGKKEFDDYQ